MDHFNKERGPQRAWTPLKYRVGKILQDTGRLRLSIFSRNTKDTAKVASNLKYAPTHNYGTKNVPMRKFMWLSRDMKKRLDKWVGKWSIGE